MHLSTEEFPFLLRTLQTPRKVLFSSYTYINTIQNMLVVFELN